MNYLLLCFLLLINVESDRRTFNEIRAEFIKEIKSNNAGSPHLNFKENLPSNGSFESINKQRIYFENLKKELASVFSHDLNESDLLDFKIMRFEADLNLERLRCEGAYLQSHPDVTTITKINQLPDSKLWYNYLLRRWLCADVNPDTLYAFGLQQVKKAQSHIDLIIQKSGLTPDEFYKSLDDPAQFTMDTTVIRTKLQSIKGLVLANESTLFYPYHIPDVEIRKGVNKDLAQTPGYYSGGVFYYNFFDAPYKMRWLDWLFIHEAIPGHHFQFSIASQVHRSEVQSLFLYYGYAEGWGAYVEEYGKQLGLYRNMYDEVGRWEWDLVRSIRVPLDIGLNYYNWSDEQAKKFWKANIRNQDDIASREIERVKRWPVQVITYKYGADQFLKWMSILKREKGRAFDIREFHDNLLKRGGLPFPILQAYVLNEKE